MNWFPPRSRFLLENYSFWKVIISFWKLWKRPRNWNHDSSGIRADPSLRMMEPRPVVVAGGVFAHRAREMIKRTLKVRSVKLFFIFAVLRKAKAKHLGSTSSFRASGQLCGLNKYVIDMLREFNNISILWDIKSHTLTCSQSKWY